jgi:hypothetical protein
MIVPFEGTGRRKNGRWTIASCVVEKFYNCAAKISQNKSIFILQALLIAAAVISTTAHASVIRGTGTGALIGHDLTDPENNGNPGANTGYNATFRANVNATFSGRRV